MENKFAIKGQVNVTRVKQTMRKYKTDYSHIYAAIDKLEKGKALMLMLKSQSDCAVLRKAVERYSKKFYCSQNRVKEGYEFFITRREDVK